MSETAEPTGTVGEPGAARRSSREAVPQQKNPPGVTRHGDRVTVTLARPIQTGDGEVAAISLREPDAGMLRGIKLIEVHELRPEAIMTLAARCSVPHVNEAQLAGLKPPDLLRLTEGVTGFFAD